MFRYMIFDKGPISDLRSYVEPWKLVVDEPPQPDSKSTNEYRLFYDSKVKKSALFKDALLFVLSKTLYLNKDLSPYVTDLARWLIKKRAISNIKSDERNVEVAGHASTATYMNGKMFEGTHSAEAIHTFLDRTLHWFDGGSDVSSWEELEHVCSIMNDVWWYAMLARIRAREVFNYFTLAVCSYREVRFTDNKGDDEVVFATRDNPRDRTASNKLTTARGIIQWHLTTWRHVMKVYGVSEAYANTVWTRLNSLPLWIQGHFADLTFREFIKQKRVSSSRSALAWQPSNRVDISGMYLRDAYYFSQWLPNYHVFDYARMTTPVISGKKMTWLELTDRANVVGNVLGFKSVSEVLVRGPKVYRLPVAGATVLTKFIKPNVEHFKLFSRFIEDRLGSEKQLDSSGKASFKTNAFPYVINIII